MTEHSITVEVEVLSADFDASRIQQLTREFVAALQDEMQTIVSAYWVQDGVHRQLT